MPRASTFSGASLLCSAHSSSSSPVREYKAASLIGLALTTGLACSASLVQADPKEGGQCASIEDRVERLACYDGLYRSPLVEKEIARPDAVVGDIVVPTQSVVAAVPQEPPPLRADAPPSERREEPCDTSFISTRPVIRSPWAYRWDLDRCEKTYSLILPHKPLIFLPINYDSNLNVNAARQAEGGPATGSGFKHVEAEFQLSFKVRLLKDLFGDNGDLWAAYTQRSFWQVYSRSESSPFRETNHEPELILSMRTPYRIAGIQGRYVNFAFNHQSNGRSNSISRSWNRVYVEAGIDGDNYLVYLKPWWRIEENPDKDDNPGIENWVGRMEAFGAYQFGKNVFSVTLRNNLRRENNRGSVELGWSYPLSDRIKAYVQYFNGYGQSLIDYNRNSNAIGVGFMLDDWL